MIDNTDEHINLSEKTELLNYYAREGLNLIPLRHGMKEPVGEWKEYQQRKITEHEINTYFLQGTQHNIGVVCGAISDNLYVLDFDTEEIFHEFFTNTEGLTIIKTGRGYHVYFKAEQPVKTLSMYDSEGKEIATLKGEGSYVVAPPSVHPNGARYEFIQRGEIMTLVGDVRQQIKEHATRLGLTYAKEQIDIERVLKGTAKGNRANSVVHLITFLRRAGIDEPNGLAICKAWNKRNKPPLDQAELEGKVNSYYRYPEPYHYFYSRDPGLWTITDTLSLEEKGKQTLSEPEIARLSLKYNDKNFGILELEPGTKSGVVVSIKDSDGNEIIPKTEKPRNFYLRERTRDTLFQHIKLSLKGPEYNDFLGQTISEIEAALQTNEEAAQPDEEQEEQTLIPISIVEKDGKLYEEIYDNGNVSFIDGEGNTYKVLDIGGVKHVPIFGDELTEGAVLLPSRLEPYKDEQTLIAEIKAHIHRYIEVSPFFETIATYYILLSWLYDEINTLPYLRVLGDTGTGKSRFLDTVGRLCYKATLVSGAITPAPIYRLLRKWHGTIVIDEGDFRASDEQNEVVKILNCGFERGRPVVRSQKDNPDSIQILPTFSPKIISSRKRFQDIALESRCLTEITQETDRADIPYLLPSAFYTVEETLRNKLLSFRFLNRGKVDIEKAQRLKDIDVENRLKQAVSSFIVLFAGNEDVYKEFTEFLTAYNRELVDERSESIEGAIVNAVYEIINKRTLSTVSPCDVQNDTNGHFRNEELKEVNITAADITALLNDKYGLHDVTSRGVGRRLKTLGITSTKKGKGAERKRYINLEERALAKLIKKYIPISVLEMDDKGVSDVDMGESVGKKKTHSPAEDGTVGTHGTDGTGENTQPEKINGDFVCFCGKRFDTVEVLRHHQANCKEFQTQQDKEAREQINENAAEAISNDQ